MLSGFGPIAIVIIDDNARSVEYLSHALARDGVEIFTALNAEQGLDLVYSRRPHIVFK